MREALWSDWKRTQSSESRFFLRKRYEQLLRSLRTKNYSPPCMAFRILPSSRSVPRLPVTVETSRTSSPNKSSASRTENTVAWPLLFRASRYFALGIVSCSSPPIGTPSCKRNIAWVHFLVRGDSWGTWSRGNGGKDRIRSAHNDFAVYDHYFEAWLDNPGLGKLFIQISRPTNHRKHAKDFRVTCKDTMFDGATALEMSSKERRLRSNLWCLCCLLDRQSAIVES